MEPENPTPLTIGEWCKGTADLARRVAKNIDDLMNGKGFDPENTLPALKERVAELDSLGIRPKGDDEFDKQIATLDAQKAGNVSTDAIRRVADYLSPPEPKEK